MHIRWHKYSNATEKATACTYYFILFKGAVGNIKKYLYYLTDLTELGFMTAQGLNFKKGGGCTMVIFV